MIRSFTITNYLGDSIFIDIRRPEKSGLLIKSVTGLGPSKADVNTTEIATMDGSYYNSARVTQRNIVFNFIFVETEAGESIETVRQKTYKFFSVKKQVRVSVVTDNRTLTATGYVESNEPDVFSSQESAQISIICPDPYLYSNGFNRTTFYGVDPTFEFPFSNESVTDPLLVFGEINTKRESNVYYTGDEDIGIYIFIHANGPAKNITIYNAANRKVMKIDTSKLPSNGSNTDLIEGDDILINTMKGQKSITLIREGVETNILNSLSKDADWFTITKGDNVFAFTAEEGIDYLQFYIENLVVYEGI